MDNIKGTINDYRKTAARYAKLGNTGTAYLAFKNLPALLKKYLHGTEALDYGCGTGTGTAFLTSMELDVIGVDIDEAMLTEARKNLPQTHFQQIKSAQIPYPDNAFDLVFSSFVLFEIATLPEMVNVLNEIYRVLKSGGIFIAITGTTDMYQHEWLSLDVNFPENKNLTSGAIAKVLLKDEDFIVYDYYWTPTDYQTVIEQTPFVCRETLHPLGEKNDGYAWLAEKTHAPYVIYVLQKP